MYRLIFTDYYKGQLTNWNNSWKAKLQDCKDKTYIIFISKNFKGVLVRIVVYGPNKKYLTKITIEKGTLNLYPDCWLDLKYAVQAAQQILKDLSAENRSCAEYVLQEIQAGRDPYSIPF